MAGGLSCSTAYAVFPDQGPHPYPTRWQGDPYPPGKSLKEKVISNILSSGFSWDTQEIFLAVLNSLKETILIHFVLETSAHQLKNASHCFGEVWDRFSPRAFCKWTSSSRLKVLHCGHCNSRLSLVRFMRLSRQTWILGLSLLYPVITVGYPDGGGPDSLDSEEPIFSFLSFPSNKILYTSGLVGSHSLLQRLFPIHGSNLGLLHCRRIRYHPLPGKPTSGPA